MIDHNPENAECILMQKKTREHIWYRRDRIANQQLKLNDGRMKMKTESEFICPLQLE